MLHLIIAGQTVLLSLDNARCTLRRLLPVYRTIYIDLYIGMVADVVHPTLLQVDDEMLGALPPTTAPLMLP